MASLELVYLMSHLAGSTALTGMKAFAYVPLVLLALTACNHSSVVLHGNPDSATDGHDEGSDGSSGSCPVQPWTFDSQTGEPSWVTNSCPPNGCPGGTTCVYAQVDVELEPLGCAPVPDSCDGTPSCACMGCVCGGNTGGPANACTPDEPGKIVCETPTA